MFPRRGRARLVLPVLALLSAGAAVSAAHADGRLVFSAMRIDAVSPASPPKDSHWGMAAEFIAPLPVSWNLLAGVLGVDGTILQAESSHTYDDGTAGNGEYRTNQDFLRLYTGVQFGPHNPALFHPYAGVNVAMHVYSVATDYVTYETWNGESFVPSTHEVRENVDDRQVTAFGWDANAGLNVDFHAWNVDAGVRYLHAYGVPRQLGGEAIRIEPAYVQYRLGVGLEFASAEP